jgi:Glycosyl transferase family 2
MSTAVTILIVPRDRFSSVVQCAETILQDTREPFELIFLDFGYDRATRDRLQAVCSGVPTRFVDCGRAIPMAALRSVVPQLTTRYLAWLDNDTFVTPGWLGALLERAAAGAQVILPVTLEREGLDVDPRRIPLRNHISHSELREVTVAGRKYVFDHKPYRRAAPEELPREAHTVDFFELHAFFIETAVLARLDIPDMVVREHIDLGIQLHRMGIPIWCEPRSSVIFDNIHTRPTLGDIRFFQYRWAEPLIDSSHDLFEKRWGYRFYNEQFMKNWAFRRKVFSWALFAGLPHGAADLASRAAGRVFRAPIPRELRPDPLPESVRVLARGA